MGILGAARRDDHPDNIQAAHRRCNREKGSRDNDELIADGPARVRVVLESRRKLHRCFLSLLPEHKPRNDRCIDQHNNVSYEPTMDNFR